MKNLIEKYLTENKYKDLPITPNQERQIKMLYKKGVDVKQLAKKMKIDIKVIRAVINEEKFSVYRSGGSVGSSKKSGEKYNKKGDLFIKDFDSKDDAKAFAKERTKRLSPGEKKYYKMKYYVESSAKKYAGRQIAKASQASARKGIKAAQRDKKFKNLSPVDKKIYNAATNFPIGKKFNSEDVSKIVKMPDETVWNILKGNLRKAGLIGWDANNNTFTVLAESKLDESSGNSGSTELWFGSWSRPLLIYVQENEVLWSYNHDFPPGYYMTDDDRQRARARGYIILDI